MMKRIAILMIFLLITGFCFASDTETSVTIQYDADSPFESAEVSAGLSLEPSSSFSYKVGFTTSGSSYNSPVATIPLTPAIDTEQSIFTFEPLTEIYVYWDIFGTSPFRLMLGATGPLTTENSESFIGWKISRLDGEGVTITWDSIPEDWESAVDSQSIEIMRYTYSGRGLPVEQNNRQLRIEPSLTSNNILGYTATTYNAYLVLSLETIE